MNDEIVEKSLEELEKAIEKDCVDNGLSDKEVWHKYSQNDNFEETSFYEVIISEKPFKFAEVCKAYADTDEGEERFEKMHISKYDLERKFDCVQPVPYWVEKYHKKEGYHLQLDFGMYNPYQYGDTIEVDGKKYEYVDSGCLDSEYEEQCEDGSLVYIPVCRYFYRILKELEE